MSESRPTPKKEMFHPSHVVEGRLNCLNCGAEAWDPAIGKPCPLARVEAAIQKAEEGR